MREEEEEGKSEDEVKFNFVWISNIFVSEI